MEPEADMEPEALPKPKKAKVQAKQAVAEEVGTHRCSCYLPVLPFA